MNFPPPKHPLNQLNSSRHGYLKSEPIKKYQARLLRTGIRRAMHANRFTLLNIIEECECRLLAKYGKLRPQGIGCDRGARIVEFLYSPLGKTNGIVWQDQEDCPDCNGLGEMECGACGHLSECDSCNGLGHWGEGNKRIETDLGGYPLNIH